MSSEMKVIRGNEVELQGDNDGIQVYKALDHSVWYIVKNSEVAFELYPAVSKQDGSPAILTEYDLGG